MTDLSLSKLLILLDQEGMGLLEKLHQSSDQTILEGRHVLAGCARSFALQLKKTVALIEEDPIFQESFALAKERTLVMKHCLQNIFLIMKYGLQHLEGDIIEFGSYQGGSAIFMANVARALGMKSTIYALDTFRGMPATNTSLDLHTEGRFYDVDVEVLETVIKKNKWENLVLVKGPFEETVPSLLKQVKKIALAHIDCDIYSSVKYAIASVTPLMNPAGGYLVFDDALCPMCLGALQAVEETLQWKGFRTEQSFPQLVYRVPALS